MKNTASSTPEKKTITLTIFELAERIMDEAGKLAGNEREALALANASLSSTLQRRARYVRTVHA
ncbi:MAG: hypothetical protein GMKNLPBB_00691 [Myxococcota bacterium]|nr:hypothetical protein [Myxococcota bacterium]